MFGDTYKKYKEYEYIVLSGGELIDGRGGKPIKDSVVIIKGDKIEKVGKIGEVELPPKDKSVLIDITGKTIMPGLIDSHTHIDKSKNDSEFDVIRQSVPLKTVKAVRNSKSTLEAGFTTIRDVGGYNLVDIGVRDAINAGLIKGPRMFVSGHVIVPTGVFFPAYPPEVSIDGRYTFNTPDEVRKGVRQLLGLGVDTIKILTTGRTFSETSSLNARALSLEEAQIAVEEAHNQGVRVSAHAHGNKGIKIALQAGCDALEHGSVLEDDDIEFMLRNGIYLVTTLSYSQHVEKLGIKTGYSESILKKTLSIKERRFQSFKMALDAGVKIAMGTDCGMPFTFHGESAYEMEVLVQEGMSPMEAIVASTYTGAELLGKENQIGSIEEDKFADIIVVQGDPLKDIKILQELENILGVIKSGEVLINRGI